MKTIDSVIPYGEVIITKTNEITGVSETITVKNLVVTSGKNFIADKICGDATEMTHMGLGSNDVTSTAGMVALQTELQRVVLDETPFATDNVVSYKATFAAGVATGSITEAGIFSAATSGIMLCRTTFPVITKNAADSITVRWNLTIG